MCSKVEHFSIYLLASPWNFMFFELSINWVSLAFCYFFLLIYGNSLHENSPHAGWQVVIVAFHDGLSLNQLVYFNLVKFMCYFSILCFWGFFPLWRYSRHSFKKYILAPQNHKAIFLYFVAMFIYKISL